MSEKQISMRLIDLYPNDFPNMSSWNRVVTRFPQPDKHFLNLDSIKTRSRQPGVVVTQGLEYGFAVRDGNHTVGRILQFFGPDAIVRFTPNIELRNWSAPGEFQADVDWRIKLVADWGVTNFLQFLDCCLSDRFYISQS